MREIFIPNWVIHNKWTDKAGIDRLIANFVDRNIDYGTEWAYNEKLSVAFNPNDDNGLQQLKFFYHKDLEKKYSSDLLYVKAFYLHHLLDFFKETRVDITNLDMVFNEFLRIKVYSSFTNEMGGCVNFQGELDEIFTLLKNNKEELLRDIKGDPLI